MRKRDIPFQLPPALWDEARMAAEREGIPLAQFVADSVVEKLLALLVERYFR